MVLFPTRVCLPPPFIFGREPRLAGGSKTDSRQQIQCFGTGLRETARQPLRIGVCAHWSSHTPRAEIAFVAQRFFPLQLCPRAIGTLCNVIAFGANRGQGGVAISSSSTVANPCFGIPSSISPISRGRSGALVCVPHSPPCALSEHIVTGMQTLLSSYACVRVLCFFWDSSDVSVPHI